MIVLGIETSCDETAVAVVRDGRTVLSNCLASQVSIHAPFGGVVPELAARNHIENIEVIVDNALELANISLTDIDIFSVTNSPGLAGALLVGLNYAKGLAFGKNKPLVGVNHIEGHVCANFLEGEAEPPFIALVVSGGHSLLIAVENYDTYRVIGSTKDDAAGEAFDKVARLLGYPYPGGPEIDSLAEQGDPTKIRFPRPKVQGLDFSFSGLKTAVIQHLAKNSDENACDIAASFREAVVDVLTEKTMKACMDKKIHKLVIAGGVACNKGLRKSLAEACNKNGFWLNIPKPEYCTDNAAMIASRGYFKAIAGLYDGLSLNAFPGRMTTGAVTD